MYRTLGVGVSLPVLAVDAGVSGWVAYLAPCVGFSRRITSALTGIDVLDGFR